MSSGVLIQTGTNRAVDLMAPAHASIDLLVDVAEALARLPRFNGHVRAGAYSVAQHCCLGADAILAETGSAPLARAFLLHDAHEYAVGDIATPAAHALEERVGRELAALMPHMEAQAARIGRACFRRALAGLKADLDIAIHGAAGLPTPSPEITAGVKQWDLRMLASERAQLFGPAPYRWDEAVESAEPVRFKGRIVVWPWPRAADEWRTRLFQLFPHLAAAAA